MSAPSLIDSITSPSSAHTWQVLRLKANRSRMSSSVGFDGSGFSTGVPGSVPSAWASEYIDHTD